MRTLTVATMIIASLVGIWAGLRFQVLILVRLTFSAIMFSYVAAMWDGQSLSASLLAIIVPVIGLQGGYMIGLTGRGPVQQLIGRFEGSGPA